MNPPASRQAQNVIAEAMDKRTPPHSIKAEQSTLGACLIEAAAIDKAVEIVSAEDFYRENHQALFRAVLHLHEQGRPVDMVTLPAELRRRDQLEATGGLLYLTSLFDAVPTAASVEFYARIVADKALLRRMLAECLQTVGLIQGDVEDVPAALAAVQERFFALGAGRLTSAQTEAGYYAGLMAAYDRAADLSERLLVDPDARSGIQTGLTDLDDQTLGLQRKELVLVAGRPSMGKSALSVGVAENAALHGTPVLLYSLEMSKERVFDRILAGGSLVDSKRLLSGRLGEDEFGRMAEFLGRDGVHRPLWVDDAGGLTVGQLRAKARRAVRQKGVGLIVIDYIQLLLPDRPGGNREQEMAQIAKGVKAMAKELNVAVLAVAQLSRSVDARTDKRPVLSDLRESGQLEQEADQVWMVYRDAYYNKPQPNEEAPGVEHEGFPVERAEILCVKNRSGETGSVSAGWQAQLVRFVNLDVHAEHYLNQQAVRQATDGAHVQARAQAAGRRRPNQSTPNESEE